MSSGIWIASLIITPEPLVTSWACHWRGGRWSYFIIMSKVGIGTHSIFSLPHKYSPLLLFHTINNTGRGYHHITHQDTSKPFTPSVPLLGCQVISSLLVPEYPFYNPSNYTRRMWYCYYVARKRGRSIRGDWIWHNNTHTVIGLYNCHTTLHRIPPSAPHGRHQQKRSNK